jgi:hypothetical protein
MRDAVPGWEVTGYSKHVDKFEAVDAKDRHVAAAAYKLSLDDWPGQAVALVTKNVKDFPAKAFGETEVTRFSLGAYVDALHAAEPERVPSRGDLPQEAKEPSAVGADAIRFYSLARWRICIDELAVIWPRPNGIRACVQALMVRGWV